MTGQLDPRSESRMQPVAATRRPRPRVLLAEDDQQMRLYLAEALTRDGYRVVLCENGWELLMHLRSFVLDDHEHENIDVVVSDIRMPGLTGMEVLEGSVDSREFPPMILITAFGDTETHTDALRLGARAIFDKPFDIDELLNELHNIAPLH